MDNCLASPKQHISNGIGGCYHCEYALASMMSILEFEGCISLLYLFCRTICKVKRKNECELIENWSEGEDWHGVCCSSTTWDKTMMALFALIDATKYSFIIVSIIDY
jgi:hypothetical protein